MDVADLMVGPRGRRLCLELAAALARALPGGDEYLRAIFVAAYHLDPGAGASRMLVSISTGDPAEAEPVVPTPADVARLLDAVPLDGVDDDAVVAALAAAVDFARYWQEPDGEDVLAATPQMRTALSRFAAAVVSSGPPAWWEAPVERATQTSVVFDDPAARPSSRTADEILSSWRESAVEEEARAQRELPSDPRANFSGTWWSTPPRDLTHTMRRLDVAGPLGLRLVEDSLGWDAASVRDVVVPAGLAVYEVDGPPAWSELCRRFPLEVTASRRHDWFRATGVAGRWVVPDWARAAEQLDGVHVTTAGYLRTAGRAVEVEADTRSVLAGWNPDETFWLTDLPPGAATDERWHRLDDAWREDPRGVVSDGQAG